jgi:hypothetical protein
MQGTELAAQPRPRLFITTDELEDVRGSIFAASGCAGKR